MSEQTGTVEETPDQHGAFPRLDPGQIETLAGRGERRATATGDVLFSAGDTTCDFFVILEGKVAAIDGDEAGDRVLAVHGPGRFLGELNVLSGQAVPVTAVVREPGEVLAIPAPAMRELVESDPELGDLVLRALLIRRWVLIGVGAGLRIVGSRYCPQTRRLREFAARNRVPHRWIDLEEDPEADALLRQLGVPPEQTPVVVWRERVLRNPSTAELARVLGLSSGDHRAACDLIVVGAGPAGLAASVYGASEGLDTVAHDGVAPGGQAATSPRIENYLGFPSGISGSELAERARLQALKFGARFDVPAEATRLDHADGHHVLCLGDGAALAARAIVIATGVRYRRLPIPGMERLEATSVYYAATAQEAQLVEGQRIAVVGGGNSAGQAALTLSEHAAHVWLVVREPELRDMSRYLADRVRRAPRIEVLEHTEVRELAGDRALEAVEVEDTPSGERRRLDARALFVFIGAEPHTGWLGGQLELDPRGYIRTGRDVTHAEGEHAPLALETSRPGIFAAGDVRCGSIKRVASAVGEGAMAVRFVHEHLAGAGAGAAHGRRA